MSDERWNEIVASHDAQESLGWYGAYDMASELFDECKRLREENARLRADTVIACTDDDIDESCGEMGKSGD